MNRMMNWMALLALVGCAASQAADVTGTQKADPKKGEALYTTGLPDRGVPACMACHGVNGDSSVAANPKLAGQHEGYLVHQLVSFKQKTERDSPVMSAYAAALSDADMRDVAAYLSRQKPGAGVAKNKNSVALAQKIYRAGIVDKNVVACAACHGPTGAGIPVQYPRIAGQSADYTEAQLIAFRDGVRKNSAQMTAVTTRLSDPEIKALADYLAGLH